MLTEGVQSNVRKSGDPGQEVETRLFHRRFQLVLEYDFLQNTHLT